MPRNLGACRSPATRRVATRFDSLAPCLDLWGQRDKSRRFVMDVVSTPHPPNPHLFFPLTMPPVRTDALDFDLPEALIAITAAEPRDAARLMVVHRDTGTVEHRRVRDLPELGVLRAGDTMVVNRSAVLPAYFEGARQATGGRVTGLYLQTFPDGTWAVMLETRGKPQPGEAISLGETLELRLIERTGPGTWVAQPCDEKGRSLSPADSLAALQRVGRPPLPPYIRKARKTLGLDEFNEHDAVRYNTVFAEALGSIAAPTAGLHFTPELLQRLDALGVQRAGVTLHVGIGTFLPVRSETLDDHPMHTERFEVPAETLDLLKQTRQRGGRTLVVGTTAVRSLESVLPEVPPEEMETTGLCGGFFGATDLFIRPDTGFEFRYTDMLLTNFHLPRSTLLAMVAALPGVGLERLLGWYEAAIAEEYRFYSYGDAMLIV